jgi:hypothetical protein
VEDRGIRDSAQSSVSDFPVASYRQERALAAATGTRGRLNHPRFQAAVPLCYDSLGGPQSRRSPLDLDAIRDYIGQHNPRAANNVLA